MVTELAASLMLLVTAKLWVIMATAEKITINVC